MSDLKDMSEPSLEQHLLLNRDLIRDAIKRERTDLVEEMFNQYEEVIGDFLSFLSDMGQEYTFEAALSDSGFFSYWPPIRTILQHYSSLVPQALKSENYEIISSFMSFPYALMSLSFEHRDHFVFQRAARLFLTLHDQIVRGLPAADKSSDLIQNCWGYPENFYRYNIQPILAGPHIEATDAETMRDYSIFLLSVLSILMKRAIDSEDVTKFEDVASSMRQIGSWIGRSPLEDLEYMEMGIPLPGTNEEKDRKKIVGNVLRSVSETRKVAFLGLGAWLVKMVEDTSFRSSDFGRYSSLLISEYSSLRDIYECYTKYLTDRGLEDLFGWDWWELRGRETQPGEPVAEPMKFSSWMAKYYLLTGLELVHVDPDALPDLDATSASQGILEDLRRTSQELTKSAIWGAYLSKFDQRDLEEKMSNLITAHAKAAEEQQRIEQDQLADRELDQQIIADFKQDVIETWRSSAVMRRLFELHGRYEVRSGKDDADLPDLMGIRQIDKKGAFSSEPGVAYVDWGGAYGRMLARGEDRQVSSEFLKLPDKDTEWELLRSDLETLIEVKSSNGHVPIILMNSSAVRRWLAEIDTFAPYWRTASDFASVQGFQGILADAPVFRVEGLPQSEVIVVDLARFGSLVQYSPDESPTSPLLIRVDPISPDRAAELMEAKPDLAKDPETGEILEGDDALRWFQLRVTVEVLERFRIEDLNLESGLRLTITDHADIE